MMRRRTGLRTLAGAMVVAMAAVGCGDGGSEAEPAPAAALPTTSEAPPSGEASAAEEERPSEEESDADVYTVSPEGSDDAPGTDDEPFATIQHGIEVLEPGDTLLVRGGTYREQVELPYAEMTRGTPDAPITVEAAPGERPVIEGRLRLSGADHWTIRGINVTWSEENEDDDHMVQFRGGTGWRFTEAEVWGARSFSAVNVGHGAHDFQLDHLYVHDTFPTNDVNQDHLIYIASGNEGGLIEHNVLATSPNGRGIKVGPGSPSEPGSDDLVIRYNTFVDNHGPSNLRFSGDSSDNLVYRNIFVRPAEGEAAVSAFELTGRNNVVRDNIFWEAGVAVASVDGVVDEGRNEFVDPQFADPDAGDYRPTNPAAEGYGAFAESSP